jgi:YesN/AraC family two-component response regulator
MNATLRVVVADDEGPARRFLLSLLRTFEDVVVVGAAESGDEALDLIEREKPDLVLLDIHMPSLDGFGVLGLLPDSLPLVTFVTAFHEYEGIAREAGAMDYLLKPIDRSTLAHTLGLARKRLADLADGATRQTDTP